MAGVVRVVSSRSSHSAGRSPAKTLLTVRQAARQLGCAAATVERLARSGAFPGAKRTQCGWLIPERAVEHRLARGRQEPHRIVPSELALEVRAHRSDAPAAGAMARPRTRAECAQVPRPCPFVSCRFNLYLDVCGSGSLVVNGGGAPELREPGCSCALDIAEREALPVDRVAELLGSTRARVKQIEERALRKLSEGLGAPADGATLLAALEAQEQGSTGEDGARIEAAELEELHPLCSGLHLDPNEVRGVQTLRRRRPK